MRESSDVIRLSFDRGTLLLHGLDDHRLQSLFTAEEWTWDPRVSAWRREAIDYYDVVSVLQRAFGDRFRDDVPSPSPPTWGKINLPTLRPEQQHALTAWRNASGRGVIVMPTGTGKTEIALAAMAQEQAATLVVAPVRDLMYQWHRRILRGLSYDAGIVGDTMFNVKPVTVTTYDSAYIHMDKLGANFGLLVFDEAHHLPGKCRREAALLSAASLRLGLTATPERSDGLHDLLDRLIGPVVYRMEMSGLRGRTLADYHVVRVPVALNEQEREAYDQAARTVRSYMAARSKETTGYSWQDLCAETGSDPEARKAQKAYFRKKSIEDRAEEKLRVLEDIFRLHVGERVIVFAGSNAMARDVSKRFLAPTLLSHSRKRERLAVLEGFTAGRFPVIVANQVLDEGVDVPAAKVAVVIGGQASTRQAKQRLGRILRKTGNVRATLYEVVCEETKDVERSRLRRQSDAYERTQHRRL
ncbi:MAG: DEAD/DEAH box helicase family protein [Planctomycetota bacterium]